MDLNTVWFILIAILWIGFFVLEGFDFGVGLLFPILGKDENRRKAIIATIGPHWDGNEVWLLTAGGATFAAFPNWYATLFSGFYLPFALLLLGLILRGVALEFRGKDPSPKWRNLWDWCFFIGSAVPALLVGVAFANFLRGIPIDAKMNYTGGFWNLLNPYALIGGLVTMSGFTLIGAVYMMLRTTGDLRETARKAALRIWLPTVIILVVFIIASYFSTDILFRLGVNPGVVPITAVLALVVSGWFIKENRDGLAFGLIAAGIALIGVTIFMDLYPRVLISSTNPDYSLTIYNASSSHYTLTVMSIVVLIFLPFVLAYQAWSYWTFRKRVTEKVAGDY
jgi:cytochrome bd ubiquinol oxidase subunit II